MKKDKIRIVSYNIHKGFSVGNRKFVLSRIRDALRALDADIVFLQEVLGEHEAHRKKYKEWKNGSQFEFLADGMWPHFAYGKNAIYSAGHHGNAILSKFPFKFSENIDVSTNKVERRGILHGVVELPHHERPIHLICLHLGLRELDRGTQIVKLGDRIESHVPHEEPLIVAGDFNDWRETLSRPLEKRLEVKEAFRFIEKSHARTFPSWLPALRLDRIYIRGLKIKGVQSFSGKPWNELSDHSPLTADLEF